MLDLFTVIFGVCFVGMWLFISHQLGQTSGWHELAAHYRAKSGFRGHGTYMQNGRIGAIRLSGILNVSANKDGLRLSVLFPFNFSTPPVFVPWSDLHASSGKEGWMHVVNLKPTKVPRATIQVYRRTAKKLSEWSEGAFTLPDEV